MRRNQLFIASHPFHLKDHWIPNISLQSLVRWQVFTHQRAEEQRADEKYEELDDQHSIIPVGWSIFSLFKLTQFYR